MVNKNGSTISSVLELLKNSEGPLSGEEIASKTGVSRVAVWKIISRLKNNGYTIESAHDGYSLISAADKPLPWELPDTDYNIEYFNELDSTMKRACKLIDAGCSDGTTVIAGVQKSGINSDGGSWKSPDGGLYLTRIRTKPFPAAFSGLYTIAVSHAAAALLEKLYKINASVKWPNSIFAQNRKAGGVLTQFSGNNGMITAAASGIGLNANTDKSMLPPGAVSIDSLTGKKISVKALAAELLESLEDADREFDIFINSGMAFDSDGSEGCGRSGIISEYEKMIGITGKSVSVAKNCCGDGSAKEIKGIIECLNSDGSLSLSKVDGGRINIYPGDFIKDE